MCGLWIVQRRPKGRRGGLGRTVWRGGLSNTGTSSARGCNSSTPEPRKCQMFHPLVTPPVDASSLGGMTARWGAPSSRATCYMHHATCYAHSAGGCPRFWDDGSRGAPPSRANATRTKHCVSRRDVGSRAAPSSRTDANSIYNSLYALPTPWVDALSIDGMTARGVHRDHRASYIQQVSC